MRNNARALQGLANTLATERVAIRAFALWSRVDSHVWAESCGAPSPGKRLHLWAHLRAPAHCIVRRLPCHKLLTLLPNRLWIRVESFVHRYRGSGIRMQGRHTSIWYVSTHKSTTSQLHLEPESYDYIWIGIQSNDMFCKMYQLHINYISTRNPTGGQVILRNHEGDPIVQSSLMQVGHGSMKALSPFLLASQKVQQFQMATWRLAVQFKLLWISHRGIDCRALNI